MSIPSKISTTATSGLMQSGNSPINAMKATSAPPQFPTQSSIKTAMRIDEIMNHGDAESSDIAEQAAQEAVDALLKLSSVTTNDLATPPASSPPVNHLSLSDRAQKAEAPRTASDLSPSPGQPATGQRADSSSIYAPSASPAPGIQATPATGTNDADSEEDDGDNEADGDPHNREFTCWVRPDCQTKQYTLSLSRKMVSDYFGRNKKETHLVDEHRWIRACRKHYQRKSYQDSWRTYKGKVVIQQLHRIAEQQQQQPGGHPVSFKVTLKCSEEKRLSEYIARLSNANELFDPLAPEACAKDDKNPDRAPLAVLREIKQFVLARSLGDGDGVLSARDCEELVNLAIKMVKDERCIRMPLFEMLPQLAAGGGSFSPTANKSPAAKAKTPKKNGGGAGKRKSADEGDDDGGSASSSSSSSSKRQKV